MQERLGLSHYGVELQESDKEKAKEHPRRGNPQAEMPQSRFRSAETANPGRKVAIARRLRSETTVSFAGSPTNGNELSYGLTLISRDFRCKIIGTLCKICLF